ncbi:MAG: radical SAM protein, partial [bacterium]
SPSQRFAEAPRGDPKRPRMVRCLNPFRWLEVNDGGEVTPCCSPWFKGSLGNVTRESPEEIWNGPRFQALREAMYPGGDWGKFCNAENCPQIKNDTWVPIDFITPQTRDSAPITQTMLDDIRDGRTRMSDGPAQVGMSCDPRCNLRCIMCSTLTNLNRDGAAIRATLEGLKAFLPTVKRLKMTGDGEVFVIPETRDFLFNFDAARYPDVEFLIHTNGVLMTPKLWDRISHLKIDWVVVSMDAATPETYEKIRAGGEWDVLMSNLRFLLEKHRQGTIRELHINMCVMRSNHRELVAFAQLGKTLGVTSVYFMPILGDYGEEQIFTPPDVACLRRISEQMRHPALNDPKVDTSALIEWREWKPSLRDQWRGVLHHLRKTVSTHPDH